MDEIIIMADCIAIYNIQNVATVYVVDVEAAMMKDLSLIEEDLKQLICGMLF